MKTPKKNSTALFVCGILLVLGTIQLKAQPQLCPYPIENQLTCPVTVQLEIWKPLCDICFHGPITIQPGQTVFVGADCCPMQDIHIELIAVDSKSVSPGTTNNVGDPDPCDSSNGGTNTIVTVPPPNACAGNVNMNYTPTGTIIQ